jgi:hypothetical protein
MSKLGILKKACGYRGNVNRCGTCEYFREQSIRLSTDSQTYRKNHHCSIAGFTVTPNGICQNWKKRN